MQAEGVCEGEGKLTWSEQQEEVFRFVEHDTRSCVIEATAGSGKTTTIVEAANRIDSFATSCFVAFNKRVADTLKSKLPASISASTFNALGNRAWKNFNDHFVEVDAYKVNGIVRERSDDSNKEFQSGVVKLVGLAKCIGLVPLGLPDKWIVQGLIKDTTQVWNDLIDEYDVDFGWGSNNKRERAIILAREVLAWSIGLGGQKIDFNDQLYLPIIFNASFPQVDIMFVDEAQDCSSINLEIIERSLAKKARVIAVGDKNQSLYHFRGAGANAIPEIVRRFNAVCLPLTVSYRCPRSVVKAAQVYVPHIEHTHDAPEGIVKDLGHEWGPETFERTDVILCRFNAPLIKLAFRLIRAKKACKVLGRDIGGGLVALVSKMKALSMNDLRGKLAQHIDQEQSRLNREGKPEKIATLLDKVECLRVFINEDENATMDQLKASIGRLFSDDLGACITLSTGHKFKGAEADRVFWLNAHKVSSYDRPDGWQAEQLRNLKYVVTTRSKKELYYIKLS